MCALRAVNDHILSQGGSQGPAGASTEDHHIAMARYPWILARNVLSIISSDFRLLIVPNVHVKVNARHILLRHAVFRT
jgi:hypothetical protein